VLRQVAEGVLIHESEFLQSNAVVVQGGTGVLLIDPGVQGYEMACLANDLRELGQPVVAGFSTHPHWDHLLWHARLGAAPRYGTARCAVTVQDRLSDAGAKARVAALIPPDIVEQVPLDLLGLITGLPAETDRIPWDGPQVRIIEHQAHAPGHAALLIEERGILVAGDLLSDVLIPMLDLNDTADPIEDYLAALRLLEGVAADVDVVVPGHGAIGGADQVHARIDQDRAYVHALRDADVLSDRGSAHRPRLARIGCPACMNGNYSTSPEEESVSGRPDSDPIARAADPKRVPTVVRAAAPASPAAGGVMVRAHEQRVRTRVAGGERRQPRCQAGRGRWLAAPRREHRRAGVRHAQQPLPHSSRQRGAADCAQRHAGAAYARRADPGSTS
jgi:glyoxylase-like metal-dependent hydrolase (beta-lactamase superfamily II)